MLKSNNAFSVDLHYTKSKYCRSFNAIFHKAANVKDELVTLQLVSSYCRPHLLYATDGVAYTRTHTQNIPTILKERIALAKVQ